MTLWYSLQSASKLTSLTANRRTVSSSSENLANNVRMRSTTPLISISEVLTERLLHDRTTLFPGQDSTISG